MENKLFELEYIKKYNDMLYWIYNHNQFNYIVQFKFTYYFKTRIINNNKFGIDICLSDKR